MDQQRLKDLLDLKHIFNRYTIKLYSDNNVTILEHMKSVFPVHKLTSDTIDIMRQWLPKQNLNTGSCSIIKYNICFMRGVHNALSCWRINELSDNELKEVWN